MLFQRITRAALAFKLTCVAGLAGSGLVKAILAWKLYSDCRSIGWPQHCHVTDGSPAIHLQPLVGKSSTGPMAMGATRTGTGVGLGGVMGFTTIGRRCSRPLFIVEGRDVRFRRLAFPDIAFLEYLPWKASEICWQENSLSHHSRILSSSSEGHEGIGIRIHRERDNRQT